MIKNFVKFELSDPGKGTTNATHTRKSLTLKYPCTNKVICTPYKLTLKPGTYKIECWGSKGTSWSTPPYPGKGAYTKGSISIFNKTDFYVYVGASGLFNSYKNNSSLNSSNPGGGATDVRLVYSDKWSDLQSLKSRIMVAAGGGGVEWSKAIGGNGGELEGGESTSFNVNGSVIDEKCKGGTQTSGSNCSKNGIHGNPYAGKFGEAGSFQSKLNDWGGLGGGGYYGGTSYDYAYAGSGGSSFISGHYGCKAIKRREESIIEHSEESFHYSGYVFSNTKMISGNKTMPLPSGKEGKWDEIDGAFRITLISFDQRTLRCYRHSLSFLFFITLSISK